jgi:hypothetical protein
MDLYIEQKKELSIKCYMYDTHTWRKAKHIHKRKPNFSWERTLHKDYYRKISVGEKNSGRDSQGAWRQDGMIGGKPPPK